MPTDTARVSDLARICWLISDYWLPFVELDDEFTVAEHMQQGIHLVMQALRPYASEAAQSELALSDTAARSRHGDTAEPTEVPSSLRDRKPY